MRTRKALSPAGLAGLLSTCLLLVVPVASAELTDELTQEITEDFSAVPTRASGTSVPAVEIPVQAETELRLPEDMAASDDPAGEVPSAAPGMPGSSDAVEKPAAVLAAEARIAEITATDGEESPELVAALEALAAAEIDAGMSGAAEASLDRAVALIERSSGVYAPRLAQPLARLGEIYAGRGKLDEAVEAYRRAQHVVHRADGVYTLEQLEYLEKISGIFIEKRKYAEADRHKNFSYFVSERNFGPDSPDLVPAMLRLGTWFQQVGKVREARMMFERAVEVLEDAYGPDDPSLIEPLLALGSATRKKGQYRKQREASLRRVIKIIENSPGVDAADRAASWARLGDFYILVDDQKRARQAYEESWATLQGADALPATSSEMFAQPRVLHFQRRMYLMENTPRASIQGYDSSLEEFPLEIEFEASIGPDGRVLDVRAVNIDATSSTRRQLRRYVREARFRPLIVDGKPVRADNFHFKETVTIVRPEGS